MNVFQILEQAAHSHGDRVAVIDTQGELTYRELFCEALAARDLFLARGIVAHSGVGLQLPNGREFIIALFALAGCGAVVVPIGSEHSLLSAREQGEALSLRSLVRLTTQPIGAVRVGGVWLRIDPLSGRDFLVPELPEAVFIRPTSGTTGKKKGVVLTHQTVLQRIEAAQNLLQLTPEDRVIWVLPMAYHFVVSIVLYVRIGACIVVCPDAFGSTVIKEIEHHRGTVIYASPTHYALLADTATSPAMKGIRYAFSTSAPLPTAVANRFFDTHQVPIRQLYGLIELGLPLGNIDGGAESVRSIGRASPRCEAAILSASREQLPKGEIGELAVRGEGMFDAYLDPFTPVGEVLQEGWFLTGDYAVEETNGNFTVIGRKKSVIIAAGSKVYPEEVEEVLNSHPAVKCSRVFGRAHHLLGEMVAAEVVLWSVVEPEELIRFCRQKLPAGKAPQSVEIVDSLPETSTGKLVRFKPSVKENRVKAGSENV